MTIANNPPRRSPADLAIRLGFGVAFLSLALGVILLVAFFLVGLMGTVWTSLWQGVFPQSGVVEKFSSFYKLIASHLWNLEFGLFGIGVLILVTTIIGKRLLTRKPGESTDYPKYETVTGMARNVRIHELPMFAKSTHDGSTTSSTTCFTTYVAFRLEVVDQIGNITGYLAIDVVPIQNVLQDAPSSCLTDGDQVSVTYVTTEPGLQPELSQVQNVSLNKVIFGDGIADEENTRMIVSQVSTGFSSKHIDYLKRNFLEDPGGPIEQLTPDKSTETTPCIRFIRVRSVTDSWLDDSSPNVNLPTLVTGILSGLNAVTSRLVYVVMGEPSSIAIYIGLELRKPNEAILSDDPMDPVIRILPENETSEVVADDSLSQVSATTLNAFEDVDREENNSTGEDQIFTTEVASPQPSTDQDKYGIHSADDLSVLIRSLRSAYPGIMVEELLPAESARVQTTLANLNCSALVVGTPATTSEMEAESFSGLGRIVDGMSGNQWAYMIVANPVCPHERNSLRDSVLAEMFDINNMERSRNALHPTARSYLELLQTFQEKITSGAAIGLWHTSTYVLAPNSSSLSMANTLIKSVLSGTNSQPDPVQVLPDPSFKEYAANFSIVKSAAPEPPGRIRYPYRYASLLTSKELSSFVHLPTLEFPGYAVIDDAKFDTDAPIPQGPDTLTLGEVVDRGRRIGVNYSTDVHRLVRHMVIAGPTGKGKTNTMLHTLCDVWRHRIPFLVIEPSKPEYRCLLDYPDVAQDLRIFTLADKTSPLRLNPFQILPGVAVGTHIDYLKSVFNASFVMYAPMPYVMERCLIEIYEDKGWNLATGENDRGIHPNAFPTLTDLYQKIEPVVTSLGYEQRITQDVIGALHTRIQTLRTGGKGMMLDTRLSTSFEELFEHPTILEMDRLADPSDKSFLIGLLFIFLNEYRVQQGLTQGKRLRHLAVVEEAHRLLSHVPPAIQYETANVKGMAVEAFCNLLVEARAYGQGFAIVEQMPSKLSPDVLKNTGLKISLGFVSVEERNIIAGSMNLSDRQVNRLASLPLGQAVVYGEEFDGPMLIAIPHCDFVSGSGRDQGRQEEDRRVREHMHHKGQDAEMVLNIDRLRTDIAPIVDTDEFQETLARFILSTVLNESALISGFPEVLQAINKYSPSITKYSPRSTYYSDLITQILAQGIDQYFEKQGRQYNWPYKTAEQLHKTFLELFNSIAIPRINNPTSNAELAPEELDRIHEFQKSYIELCRVPFYPFAGCHKVCPNNICLYRHNMAVSLRDIRLENKIMKVLEKLNDPERSSRLVDLISIVARRTLLETTPPEESRKAALCFMIQKSEGISGFDYVHRRVIIDGLVGVLDGDASKDQSGSSKEKE